MIFKFIFITLFLSQAVIPIKSFCVDSKTHKKEYGLISKNWIIKNKLSGYRIFDFVKDKKGFMWIGTNKGLIRFDGNNVKIFDEKNVGILNGGVLSELKYNNNGDLFFLNRFNIIKKDNENNFFKVNIKNVSSIRPFSILMDTAGTMLVGSLENGLYKMTKNNLVPVSSNNKPKPKRISSFLFNKNKQLWIGTFGDGIYEYYNNKFIYMPWNNKLPSKRIRNLFIDSYDRLWIATNKGVFLIKNYESSKKFSLSFIADKIIKTFAEDEENNIWMGSSKNGIIIYKKNKIINFKSISKLLEENISKISVYREEVWVGTIKGGIYLLRKSHIYSIGKREGLKDDYVNSVYEDRDGSVFIGTKKGLYKLNKYLTSVKKLKYLKKKHIFAIIRTKKNELIFGTRYNGLFVLKKDKTIINYKIADGLKSDFIRCLLEDDDGSILIGSNGGGISVLKDNKISSFKIRGKNINDLISFIYKSKSGNYWIGSSGDGVNIVDKNGFVKVLNKNNGLKGNVISSIAENKNGDIWLSINGGGIALIKNNKIYSFTTEEGLLTNTILNVKIDNEGNIWCSSPYGILKIMKNSIDNFISGKKKQIRYRNYNKSDGMISDKCTGASPQTAAVTKDGILFFSTMSGLVQVNPSDIQEEDTGINLYFDKITVNKNLIPVDKLTVLPPNPDRIEFKFGVIDFYNPSSIYFKCKLKGLDKNWIDLEDNKTISYSHLPYGNYEFKLVGYNKGNKKNLASISKMFIIEPYYWETLKFQIIASLIFIMLLVILTKYIINKKYERKIRLIEAEHALENERMRIATDMHDEFGASISKINLLTEIAKQRINDKIKTNKIITEISNSGISLAESMDEIVWAVNPKNDRLDKMLFYITNYFENHLELTELSFKYKIPDEIPEVFVSADFRHNIFCVIKEGINNIIKHSGATKINIFFKYTSGRLKIELKDNGIGIDENNKSKFGNGINNMRNRIKKIGGNIIFANLDSGGLIIRIEVDVNMTQK